MPALGPGKRGAYHHGNLPTTLLDAALEVIAERGITALTVREVAQRVGVTHAAPYRHFRDKSTLLTALAEHGFARLGERLRNAGAGERTRGSERFGGLCGMANAYVRFALDHPAQFRIMFGPDAALSAALKHAAQDMLSELVCAVGRAQDAGLLRAGNAAEMAWVVWSQLHGLAMLLLDGRVEPEHTGDVEDLSRMAVHKLIEGLAGQSSACTTLHGTRACIRAVVSTGTALAGSRHHA